MGGVVYEWSAYNEVYKRRYTYIRGLFTCIWVSSVRKEVRSDSVEVLLLLCGCWDGLVLACLDGPFDDEEDGAEEDEAEEEEDEEEELFSKVCLVLMTVASSFAHSKMGFTRFALVSPSSSLTDAEMRDIACPRAVSTEPRARSRVSLVWGSRDLYLHDMGGWMWAKV